MLDSGVYGIVNHAIAREEENFNNLIEFLHKNNPTGNKSRTISEIIKEKLIPEKELSQELIDIKSTCNIKDVYGDY